MIVLGPNKFMVESIGEIPPGIARGVDNLYMDAETNSYGDPDGGTYFPGGTRVAGWAVTADDLEGVYYVPYRHEGLAGARYNLPVDQVQAWLKDTVENAKRWSNHSVVFDAMGAAADGAMFAGELECTLTKSKVFWSDRMSYKLKDLFKEWLGRETSSQDRILQYLASINSKNYADVPPDIMGLYACDDVQGNRELNHYLDENLDEELDDILEMERKLTPVLFDMEHEGLRINVDMCKKYEVASMRSLVILAEKIETLSGREWTNSSTCCYDILINQYGLPVLKYTEKKDEEGNKTQGGPSFDKDAMALYSVHPSVTASEKLTKIVSHVLKFREQQYIHGAMESWRKLDDGNGHIHPSYNQVVRTGRMSCRNPNAQGFNALLKSLIIPDDGCSFWSSDYSQIEFRLIVHYIQDWDAINAYNTDKDTDFHQWVADLLHIHRKPAKQLNFGMGYGAGEARVISELMVNSVLVAEVSAKVNALIDSGQADPMHRIRLFQSMVEEHASKAYQLYHERLPGIKQGAKDAARQCRRVGYVRTAYKRRRHLPDRVSRKAFNACIQGSAMDIMKDRMIALSPRYNSHSRRIGLRVRANVHDEVLNSVPAKIVHERREQCKLLDLLESPSVEFRVPIRTGLGVSVRNWGEASGGNSVFASGDAFEVKSGWSDVVAERGVPVAGAMPDPRGVAA